MKKLVEKHGVQEVPQFTIKVNPFLDMHTKYFTKRFQFTYDKRRVVNSGMTLPYGFVNV
jgi:hypothetical protein